MATCIALESEHMQVVQLLPGWHCFVSDGKLMRCGQGGGQEVEGMVVG